jgi:hypothetical protein
LFCGLFPGIAKKRQVNVSYFFDMGQAAYLTVSELKKSNTADLYYQLSAQFAQLQQILQAIRGEFIQFRSTDYGVLSPIDLMMH